MTTQEVLKELKERIQTDIKEIQENSIRHAEFVRHNGEMMIGGMNLCISMIDDLLKKER